MKKSLNTFPFLVFLILLLGFSTDLYGQRKDELKDRIKHKRSEIENANNLLKATRENRKSSIHELYILKKRISLRNELIEQLNSQVRNLDSKIQRHERRIEELQKEIKQLKNNYEKIIYHAYLNNKGLNKLMFILSSESFNQAYKRFKYIHQYAEFRRTQAKQIRLQKEKLELKLQELRHLRSQKEEILAQKISEKKKLKHEQIQVNQQVRSLKTKEEQLRKDIQQDQQVIAQLEKEVQKIIEEEKKRTKLWKNLSERQKKITQAFAGNKGNLEWPVNKGVVTRPFGESQHPVLKGVKTYNNGVDISASSNSQVKSIFDGIARKVVSIPGANLTVIIRHGNYLTVYSNLVNVNIKPGDRVAKGEIIGEVYNDESTNENILHLEIYHENQKLNPELWLD